MNQQHEQTAHSRTPFSGNSEAAGKPIPLTACLFAMSALEAAPRLLGQTLVRLTEDGEIRCRIVETESYGGAEDKGSHAYSNRRTARTETMFQPGGGAYVYLIYGMYHCLNVVTGAEDDPQAVLIRAVEPLTDRDAALMASYRGGAPKRPYELSGGPGRLCKALRIDKSLNGIPLHQPSGPLWLEAAPPAAPDFGIMRGPRINIDYAEEYASKPWRFIIENHAYNSAKKAPLEWFSRYGEL
ncbi:DNA-3-methyladenine glycosylase [Paenibacillus enshidis]|uniref:Putative 3-methyladenine DNA glycosylase n=1 Tax=Paenibacillus enshidis TaxID=1458439 RepID=A0ABV5AY43_9BACL